MMRILISLMSGLIFSAGLVLSDMIDPARVLGFLRIFSGAWDPTLAFVMGGAMLPMALAWRLRERLDGPVAGGSDFPAPASKLIDRRLLIGAGIFGIGWGLVGLCPGPALAALGLGGMPVLVFGVAMFGGMWLAGVLSRRGI